MTPLAWVFLVATTWALLALPRKYAPLPLLIGTCYMTLGQGLVLGPFNFPVIRLLLLAGFLRVSIRGEKPVGAMLGMDWLMVSWACWALFASAFHQNPGATLTNHLGMVFTNAGVYILFRCLCRDDEDVLALITMIGIVLLPVALEMVQEQLTRYNMFSVLGGVSVEPSFRNGRIRAQGPFAHAILAGTVGAVCAPLMLSIWSKRPTIAKVGLGSCLLMILGSASSGPLMSLMFSGFALLMWRWRHLTGRMRIMAVLSYFLLVFAMEAPVYYLIARIDLTGGSTGYHRALLIDRAFQHLSEWWWIGTDYTRHWMPTGVSWSKDHSDITNHYLAQGVRGGLPLMVLFILTIWTGFRYIGRLLRSRLETRPDSQFLIWTLGASLFGCAASGISVAYFDQSRVFVYLFLAIIASLVGTDMKADSDETRSTL